MAPEDLVDQIYEAAVVPELWPDVLARLSGYADVAAAVLVVRAPDQWLGWRTSPGIEQAIGRYLGSDISLESVTTPRLVQAQHPGFLTDRDLFSREEYCADPLFRYFLAPNGFFSGAATEIALPTKDVAIVQVVQRREGPPIGPREVARLDALRPHLARSVLLAARWRLARLRAVTEALELVGLPSAVVDDRGRVLVANGAFERLESQVQWRAANRFAFMDQRADALLAETLGRIEVVGAAAARSFPLRGQDAEEAAVAHVTPIGEQGREIFGPAIALLTIAPLGAAAPKAGVIQNLFDLTPAEAHIAAGLLEGLNVRDISHRRQVSEHTVRAQIKSVLGKAGVRRQTEFVAMLRNLRA